MVESMTREELNRHLYALVGSESLVKQWWMTPNRAWQGREPDEIWACDPEEVISYVMRFCYGDYS
jgi:hypothetical protein